MALSFRALTVHTTNRVSHVWGLLLREMYTSAQKDSLAKTKREITMHHTLARVRIESLEGSYGKSFDGISSTAGTGLV